MRDSLWAIRCVWMRYFDVFRKGIVYALVSSFTEPVLYLLSFGLGVGSLVNEIQVHGHAVSYRSFIFAGVLGQTMLFQGFFEAAYGAFIRMYYQKIFHAMATTPVTLSEVLWGELLWDATKTTLAATIIAIIGVAVGNFLPRSLMMVPPFAFLAGLLFAGLGLAVAGYSRTIEQISYPQYLLVFPMFLFCGVFYPIDNLPRLLQPVAWCLPLTSVLSLARTITLDFPFEWQAVPIFLAWLAFLTWFSRRAMRRRLVH